MSGWGWRVVVNVLDGRFEVTAEGLLVSCAPIYRGERICRGTGHTLVMWAIFHISNTVAIYSGHLRLAKGRNNAKVGVQISH